MKIPSLTVSKIASLLLLAVFASVGGGLLLVSLDAQQSTQEIGRLYSKALDADATGDYATAKETYEKLLKLSPNDLNVRSRYAEVSKKLASQPSLNATEDTAQPLSQDPMVRVGQARSDDVIMSVGPGGATPAATGVVQRDTAVGSIPGVDFRAEIAAARAAMSDARRQIRNGALDEAEQTLSAAINGLTPAAETEDISEDLRYLQDSILLERAEAAIEEGDWDQAREYINAFENNQGETRRSTRLTRRVSREAEDPRNYEISDYTPEYEAEVERVNEMILEGRVMFLGGNYDEAFDIFSRVEGIDPDNPEAKYFLREIAKVKTNRHELNYHKTKAQMLQEINEQWMRPSIFDRDVAAGQEVGDSVLQQKLDEIMIPRVNFNGLPLTRVIETLSEYARQFDDTQIMAPNGEIAPPGVNLVILDQGSEDPTVDLTLSGLNLGRILTLITQQINWTYEVRDDVVVLTPGSGEIGMLQTEFFPISQSAIIRMIGSEDQGGGGGGGDPFADPFAAAPEPGAGQTTGERAQKVQDFLESAGVPFSSVPGAQVALADGQLIVTNTLNNLNRVGKIMQRYSDIKQVEIESKFLEVQQGDLDEFGIDWVIQGGEWTFQTAQENQLETGSVNRNLADAFVVDTNTRDTVISTGSTLQQGDPFFNPITGLIETPVFEVPGSETRVPNPPPDIPGQIALGDDSVPVARYNGFWGRYQVAAAIRALSRRQGNDLMSAPKVTVLSGKSARIEVGQQLLYPTSYGDIESEVSQSSGGVSLGGLGGGGFGAAVTITAGTPQDFEVQTVGVTMDVTPTVEDNNAISLLLEPVVTEFEGFVEYGGPSVAIAGNTTVTVPAGFYQPIFSVRTVRTEVTIWDGATIILGGLTREQVVTVNDKVPVLGDIPLVGRLFRSEGRSAQKRNLLIFVTANLVTPGGAPAQQTFGTSVTPSNTYQNPTIVTPSGSMSRRLSEDAVEVEGADNPVE